MTSRPYDAVVVGASLAGCTAATLLARQGLRIALIERHPDVEAYKKACTHYIQPSATKVLSRLGVQGELDKAQVVRSAFTIRTPWGWIRAPREGSRAIGYNLRRERLDPLIRRVAVNTPGVEYLPGNSIRALKECEDSRLSRVEIEARTGQTQWLETQLVVGADGRYSKVAELSGSIASIAPNNRFGYYAYYSNLPLPWGSDSLAWIVNPEIGYALPTDGGLTLLAYYSHKTPEALAAFRTNPEQSFNLAFDRLPDCNLAGRGIRISPIKGMISMENVWRKSAIRNVAFIGDAACTSDPLWGVGCGWAFQSAEWLADSVGEALLARKNLSVQLKRYVGKHRAMLWGHSKLIASFSKVRKFNMLEFLLMSGAAHDMKLSEHFHEFVTRSISVKRFIAPWAIMRSAWLAASRKMRQLS